VSGNVQEIKANVGDKITQGQVLAVLDKKTYMLNVEAAEATVGRAEVELQDAQSDLERLQRIAAQDPGATSERALDQAEAKYNGAQQALSYANSRLNLAKRDLDRTELLAPYAGVVAERHVDAFQEVSRGQKVFDLNMEGAMEAAVSIPESEIKLIYLGLPAQVQFSAISDQSYKGIVTEISQVAGAANAFPIKVTIVADDEKGRIRPGITAEVTLVLGDEEGDTAYLIPIGAFLPGSGESGGYVYVFDTESSTVKKTAIEDGGIRDDTIIVNKGLKAGDIIAVAGVSFLRDGQKVRLMDQ
jgi:RND family efflux transporter MFP subunit